MSRGKNSIKWQKEKLVAKQTLSLIKSGARISKNLENGILLAKGVYLTKTLLETN